MDGHGEEGEEEGVRLGQREVVLLLLIERDGLAGLFLAGVAPVTCREYTGAQIVRMQTSVNTDAMYEREQVCCCMR